MRALSMALMLLIPKKTLSDIQKSKASFIVPVKANQKGLLDYIHEVESISSIDSHHSQTIKQSNDTITREIMVYSNFTFAWSGVFISTIIRIDKAINNNEPTTHYYISQQF